MFKCTIKSRNSIATRDNILHALFAKDDLSWKYVEISQTFSEGHLVQVSEVISGHSVDPAAINCPSVDCWTYNENEKKCELKPISSCYTLLCDYDKIELEFSESLFAMNSKDELEINHVDGGIFNTEVKATPLSNLDINLTTFSL